jgi:hypothetical protein
MGGRTTQRRVYLLWILWSWLDLTRGLQIESATAGTCLPITNLRCDEAPNETIARCDAKRAEISLGAAVGYGPRQDGHASWAITPIPSRTPGIIGGSNNSCESWTLTVPGFLERIAQSKTPAIRTIFLVFTSTCSPVILGGNRGEPRPLSNESPGIAGADRQNLENSASAVEFDAFALQTIVASDLEVIPIFEGPDTSGCWDGLEREIRKRRPWGRFGMWFPAYRDVLGAVPKLVNRALLRDAGLVCVPTSEITEELVLRAGDVGIDVVGLGTTTAGQAEMANKAGAAYAEGVSAYQTARENTLSGTSHRTHAVFVLT